MESILLSINAPARRARASRAADEAAEHRAEGRTLRPARTNPHDD